MMIVMPLGSDEELFKGLSHRYGPEDFVRNATIAYKGQIPNVAVLLLEGIVICGDQKFIVKAPKDAVIIAFSEVRDLREVSNDIVILKESKAMILDRKAVLDLEGAKA